MRDAAGECADAFHPLRTEKLRLELFLFGDVGIDRENRPGLAGLIAHQRPPGFDEDFAAGLRALGHLADPVAPTERGLERGLVKLLTVVKQILHFAAERLARTPAKDPLRAPVPVVDAAFQVQQEDRILRMVEQCGLFADLLLGVLRLGDVRIDDEDGLGRAVGLADERPAAVHGELRAIAGCLLQATAPFSALNERLERNERHAFLAE